MKELFSLGELYPSDFLKDGEEPRSPKVELKLVMEDNGLVHLEKMAHSDVLWGKYWYRSSVTQTMRDELKNIVDSIFKVVRINPDDIFLDIACNDGTLLSYVGERAIRLGIDPAQGDVTKNTCLNCDAFSNNYFSKEAYGRITVGGKKAKIVTCIAMFYDLTEPEKFLYDVHQIMEDDGLFVMQLSYTPLMLKQLAFDNLCHEHWAYYELFTLSNLLTENGFKIVDAQLNDTNAGSMRVYMMKEKGNVEKFGSKPYRDVCNWRLKSLIDYEETKTWDRKGMWQDFYHNINKLKDGVVSFIKTEKANGKKTWGYGASTKGNTLLQYFGLGDALIDGIAERSEEKYGLRTVGTNIKILSEADMRREMPDYLLILPWHFISEFKEREREYLMNGGKFIVPCPEFKIITKDDL